MVFELKSISDSEEQRKKVMKFTECFELLDRLGADNCIDVDDFEEEDLDDALF